MVSTESFIDLSRIMVFSLNDGSELEAVAAFSAVRVAIINADT